MARPCLSAVTRFFIFLRFRPSFVAPRWENWFKNDTLQFEMPSEGQMLTNAKLKQCSKCANWLKRSAVVLE